MLNADSSIWLTRPERPKMRMNPSPMTKGGVMIGRNDSARRSFLKRKSVRVAINANARPSAVVPAPVKSASKSVFHATPQRRPSDKQPIPQTLAVSNLPKNADGDQAPAAF